MFVLEFPWTGTGERGQKIDILFSLLTWQLFANLYHEASLSSEIIIGRPEVMKPNRNGLECQHFHYLTCGLEEIPNLLETQFQGL